VDGTPATIAPAFDALRAVAIPAGEHTVTFSYRPAPNQVGVALAAITAVLIAGWLVAGSLLQAAVSRIRRR
jgi:hypothetical protein